MDELNKNNNDITIEQIMASDVLTGTLNMPVIEAVKLMIQKKVGSIVVMENAFPAGIFTERDLMKLFTKTPDISLKTIKLKEVMTQNVITTDTQSDIEEIYKKMSSGNFRHLLITKNKKLKGIISVKDLIRAREQILERAVEERTKELAQTKDKLANSLQQIERDMEYAGSFQRSLLSKEYPKIPGVKFSHFYKQAKSIGGDHFEIVKLNSNLIGIFMIDVMGHGITSAMVAAIAKINFNNLIKKISEPSDLTTQLAKILSRQIPENFFIVGFYGLLNTKNLKLKYTSFGLPIPGMFRHKDKWFEPLRNTGMPIGIQNNIKYAERNAQLYRGDKLFLFTDGCVDERNGEGEILGEERFLHFFMKAVLDGKTDIIKTVCEKLELFIGKADLTDDITILLLEFSEEPVAKIS